jgi:hypothetical protein
LRPKGVVLMRRIYEVTIQNFVVYARIGPEQEWQHNRPIIRN